MSRLELYALSIFKKGETMQEIKDKSNIETLSRLREERRLKEEREK